MTAIGMSAPPGTPAVRVIPTNADHAALRCLHCGFILAQATMPHRLDISVPGLAGLLDDHECSGKPAADQPAERDRTDSSG